MQRHRLPFVSSLVVILCISAPAADVALEFRHVWRGKPLVLDEWLPRDSGEKVCINRLAYLVSQPKLEASSGNPMARKDWFWFVDAREKESRVILAGLPDEKFTGLGFSIGLDAATNRSDANQYVATHALNPNRNNLHWSWQGSYIFIAIEGKWRDASGRESGFAYHLGNDAMLMPIRILHTFDAKVPATWIVDFNIDRVLGDSKAVPIDGQSSTHGRSGDDLAATLKKRIEQGFEAREAAAFLGKAESPPSSAPVLVGTPYRFTMPARFPLPSLPLDFPLTNERVELGRRLFHEKALSLNGTVSCASCHSGAAFSDARRLSVGLDGRETARHAMPLINLAWKSSFFWDGRATSLREQALAPIQDTIEMHETLSGVEGKLAASQDYPRLFKQAFGDSNITAARLGIAVEQFLVTLTSFDSQFDRAARGEAKLTEQEQRGFELFFTEYEPRMEQFGADCFHCHGGAFFTDHSFHNNGIALANGDTGLGKTTGREADAGKFSTPSLRNVAVTAPYMHDGRFATLEAVVAHYTEEILPSPTLDANLAKHAGRKILLSAADKAALVAFLKTLTDSQFEK